MLCTHSALTCPRGQLPSESEDNFAVLFQLRYYDSSASLAAGWHRRKAGQNSRCVIQAVGQGCGVTPFWSLMGLEMKGYAEQWGRVIHSLSLISAISLLSSSECR